VLTSNEPERLLATIRSRTLPLHVPALSGEEVTAFLRDVASAAPPEAERAGRLARGSIGRALGFLPDGDEPGPLERLRQDAFHLLRAALGGHRADEYGAALGFAPAGARALADLFSFLEEWLRDLAASAAGADELFNADARDFLARMVRERGIHPLGVAEAMTALDEARALASGNVNPQLIVAGLLAGIRAGLEREFAAAPAGRAGDGGAIVRSGSRKVESSTGEGR
jgi:hypothetical protein